MNSRRIILILSAVIVLTLYVGGYFIVVHKRLWQPFISWPIMRPKPMVACYQPYCFRVIYEPLVQLDQKMFPAHWMCPVTPPKEYQLVPQGFDLDAFYKTNAAKSNVISAAK